MRGRMMAVVIGAALGLALATPAMAQDPPPDLEEIFSPWAALGLDPLGEAAPEDIPAAQQPDYYRQPLFRSYFGSGLASGTGRASVALGAGPNGLPRVYVATTNDRVQMFDATSPGASLGTFGSFEDAAGIAYYRGKVYVVDRRPTNAKLAKIEVFDASGAWLRTIPLVNPAGLADMTGIDIAGGEIWVTGAICGGFAGIVQILDVETGALKRISAHLAHSPTGDANKPCEEAWDASAWWDISVVPELEAAVAEYRLLHRNVFAALTTPDPEIQCTRCYRKLWQDGTDAVWGMRWLLVVDGDSRTSRGTGVTEYAIDPAAITGEPYLIQRRLWAPKQATTGGVRDIAYQNREVRIDWKGHLADDRWQRGRQCIDEYDVSDADFYAIGAQGEYWHEPARGFQKIEMWLRPNVPAGSAYQKVSFEQTVSGTTTTMTESPNPSGNMCVDTGRFASGEYTLQLRAYVNLNQQTGQTKVVTIDNPLLRLDNTRPTGAVDPVPQYARDTVTVGGTVADAHSEPLDWQLQISPRGQNAWSDAAGCPRQSAPDPATAKYGCSLDTTRYGDGDYDLRAVMRDRVDSAYGGPNVGYATAATTIDNTPPDTSVLGPGDGRDATFGSSANEGSVAFECSLDSGEWEPCSPTTTYPGIGRGP